VVLIEGDRISRVGDADSIRIPAGANVIELQGATLLASLMDPHVHLLSNHDDKG
jgi:imidazolonepropionase-like amidohydrolase